MIDSKDKFLYVPQSDLENIEIIGNHASAQSGAPIRGEDWAWICEACMARHIGTPDTGLPYIIANLINWKAIAIEDAFAYPFISNSKIPFNRWYILGSRGLREFAISKPTGFSIDKPYSGEPIMAKPIWQMREAIGQLIYEMDDTRYRSVQGSLIRGGTYDAKGIVPTETDANLSNNGYYRYYHSYGRYLHGSSVLPPDHWWYSLADASMYSGSVIKATNILRHGMFPRDLWRVYPIYEIEYSDVCYYTWPGGSKTTETNYTQKFICASSNAYTPYDGGEVDGLCVDLRPQWDISDAMVFPDLPYSCHIPNRTPPAQTADIWEAQYSCLHTEKITNIYLLCRYSPDLIS